MQTRRLATFLAVSCLFAAHATAETPLSKSVKKAMLDEATGVPVIVRWRDAVANAGLLGRVPARHVPLFRLSAVRLPAAKIEELSRSAEVTGIFVDETWRLDEPQR